jgi:preprotein translocase subunit SecG
MVQNPKGGGLSSTFGNSQQIGGVQKTTDFLDKSTWTLGNHFNCIDLVFKFKLLMSCKWLNKVLIKTTVPSYNSSYNSRSY